MRVKMIELFSYLIAFCFIGYCLHFKIDNYYTILFLFFVRVFWYIAYEYEYVNDLIFYLTIFCFLHITICTILLCNNWLRLHIRIASAIAIILSLYQLLFLFNTSFYNEYIIIVSNLNIEIVLSLFNLKTKIKTLILTSALMLPHVTFII